MLDKNSGVVMFGDVVEANGYTIRENNLFFKAHNIPVGALVEFDYDEWGGRNEETFIKGKARMFVVHHDRDCDGTPLYSLAMEKIEHWMDPDLYNDTNGMSYRWCLHRAAYKITHGHAEENLTVIRLPS
jgi:hypothetical protein